jgi:NADPH:quinone reductase-like Zn-dependent oxidoreductase
MKAISKGDRLKNIAGLVDAGVLKVIVGKERPLSETRNAHETSGCGHATGKITLQVVTPKRIIAYAESVHDKRP